VKDGVSAAPIIPRELSRLADQARTGGPRTGGRSDARREITALLACHLTPSGDGWVLGWRLLIGAGKACAVGQQHAKHGSDDSAGSGNIGDGAPAAWPAGRHNEALNALAM